MPCGICVDNGEKPADEFNAETATMIAEEDIDELVRQWDDVPRWIKAHVKARYSAHRYEGKLT